MPKRKLRKKKLRPRNWLKKLKPNLERRLSKKLLKKRLKLRK
jgi:hypothetical protein